MYHRIEICKYTLKDANASAFGPKICAPRHAAAPDAAPPHRPARTTARPGRENNPAARADKSADRISRPADMNHLIPSPQGKPYHHPIVLHFSSYLCPL